MAPTLARSLLSRLAARGADSPTRVFDRGPLAARAVLVARDAATTTADPHKGVTSPQSINNNGMFALFGLLGAAICITMIWFFFWAKNGGFHFRSNDWDDYKSTVLRRKGPNGTILSNATPSTDLGGGSVYKDVDNATDDATTVITGVTGTTDTTDHSDLTGITGGVSDFLGRERRRKKREQREREKERRREEKATDKLRKKKDRAKSRSSRKVNEDGVLVDEMAEADAQAYLRDYRHEKAARVGGINKASDGSTWDGSNPSASSAATESTVTSELMPNRERTPTSTPTKKSGGAAAASASAGGGIRKVYSTADRNAAREQERLRSEARRLQERGKRASHSYTRHAASSSGGGGGGGSGGGGRRDFSWQYGEDASTPLRQIDEGESARLDDDDGRSHLPGAWTDAGQSESDLGTKSYHHIIPGLSAPSTYEGSTSMVSQSTDLSYAEEKRKQRQQRGYGRG